MANHGSCADDRTVANGHPFQNRAVGPDEDLAADVDGDGFDGLSAAERDLMHVRIADQAA